MEDGLPASASLSSIRSAASDAACAYVPVPSASLRSKPGPTRHHPLNTVNRVVAMAAGRGMIKELLEDNTRWGNHRIMGGGHRAIMKLPGAPRALAGAAQIPLSGKPHQQNGMTEAKAPKGQRTILCKPSPAGFFSWLHAASEVPRKPWTRDAPAPARRGFSGNPDTLCYIPAAFGTSS